MEKIKRFTKLGIISLIFSIFGIIGMFVAMGIYFLIFNHPMIGSIGLILMLIIASIGLLGLCLGVVAYKGKNKDILGLIAFIIGIISIIFNTMWVFCGSIAGMH